LGCHDEIPIMEDTRKITARLVEPDCFCPMPGVSLFHGFSRWRGGQERLRALILSKSPVSWRLQK
ncbi:MAG: hypothetical protein ACLQVY_06495, partial [Limisphaerales bacterium]